MRWLRRFRTAALLATLFASAMGPTAATESVCYGTSGKGRLLNGTPLPSGGPNFRPYSTLAQILDRTYVHSLVAEAVARAYRALAVSHPELRYVYGESGHARGGRFRPHRTHQNGLSVDFMVPVRNSDGKSVPLPTWPWTRWGYDIEFDERGRFGEYRIDFEALAAHLKALHEATKFAGFGIERVILDPNYLPLLFATPDGAYLKANLTFLRRPAWVRHDEHYHVDFAVPCRPYDR
jgi:penicillin-insensitive murein endopeptidase